MFIENFNAVFFSPRDDFGGQGILLVRNPYKVYILAFKRQVQFSLPDWFIMHVIPAGRARVMGRPELI